MIQTVNSYGGSRTAEIMSRYRPIAPKPEPSQEGDGIAKSPYLRNVWPHLQARPTRTRKRTRAGATSASFSKRQKQVDLNPVATPPEEMDFLKQLQQPLKNPVVISPRPVRPVGSKIIVSEIGPEIECGMVEKGASEVEAMVESEIVPAILSDSNNKVRMANSAYREMLGQPECGWLDCASLLPGGTCSSRRIGGGISLRFVESYYELIHAGTMQGFCCKVKIKWETAQGKKKSVAASCTAERIVCPSNNYSFLWRFKTMEQPESESQIM